MKTNRCLYNIDGRGVSALVLNRPEKCNAIDRVMIEQLGSALARAAENSARVLVLSANGCSFCAGIDLAWMRDCAEAADAREREGSCDLAQLLLNLYRFPCPVVGLVQGDAYGGGIGLLACCDIVLAAEGVAFAFSEVRLGLVPAVIAPYVIKAIGEREARRYFLTGERFDAMDAARMGLVHETVPADRLVSRTEEVIAQLLQGGPNAQSSVKAMLYRFSGAPVNRVLTREAAELTATVRAGDEGLEGMRAFLERRPPSWRRERGDV